MVICLKCLCIALWLFIMIKLILASKYTTSPQHKEVTLYVDDETDIEMAIRNAFLKMKDIDRLVIKDLSTENKHNQLIINRILNKNHSILYSGSDKNFG